MNKPRSAMDVFEMLPEGTLAEVINNQLYMPPSPTFEHQDSSMSLSVQIGSFVIESKLGKVLATIDVYLDEENVFEPDLVFLSNENLHLVRADRKIHGAPDLVIEILSPSNRNYDLKKKKPVYERCGVQELWIIDPLTKQTWGFFLQGNKYAALPSSTGKIKSKVLKKTFSF
ncbi:MAG TPA: Uma2 family endonuclease [Chitinophagales bacterium]|nr:Uma2 family endonuclease [Chitinophagales bacterium]